MPKDAALLITSWPTGVPDPKTTFGYLIETLVETDAALVPNITSTVQSAQIAAQPDLKPLTRFFVELDISSGPATTETVSARARLTIGSLPSVTSSATSQATTPAR